MKVRLDFVTNSSSSSYVCEICGGTRSGWDMSLEEAQMYQCAKAHTFCRSHAEPITDEIRKIYVLAYGDDDIKQELLPLDGKELSEFLEEYCEDTMAYEWPSALCPICSLTHIRDKDMLSFLLAGSSNRENLSSRIRGEFKNLTDMQRWIDENQK